MKFLDCLRVVRADTAHSCTADFIKQALYVPVFLHIPVSGGVLLFFLPCGEVGTSGNQDRGNAPRNFIALVHIRRQFPGISVKQTVNLFMVHRVNTFFLPFRDLYGFVNVAAVFCRCAARFVIVKAVHILCAAGGGFIDRIVRGSGRRFLCPGFGLRGFAAGFLWRVCLFLWGCFRLFWRGDFRLLCDCFGLRLFLCLSFRLLLLDFCKMPVNGFNQLCGGAFDGFKRAFQFGKLPPAAPPGDVAERIVRRVKPVMLADGVSDTFRLYLAGAAVWAFRRVDSGIMQRRMGDFMDSGFDVL